MQVVLETNRLILRSWTDADLEPFHSICSDSRIMQFIGNGQTWSREQTKNFIDRANSQWRQHGFCQWPLILKDEGTLIGFCGFIPDERGAEIGWRLGFPYWGSGLATEAAQAALTHGFETWGFNRVMATIQSGNRASVRIVEKLGMYHEGQIQRDGREVLVYAVAKPNMACEKPMT